MNTGPLQKKTRWRSFLWYSNGWAVWYLNGIQKLDHLVSNLFPTIWIPNKFGNQIPTVIGTNIFESNSSKINLNMFGVKCKVFLVCQQHFAVLKCFGCTTLLLIIEINKQVCFGYSYLHFNKKFRAYLILLETSCSLVQILWRSCLNRYILKFLGRSILLDSSFWYILASKIRAFCLDFCGKSGESEIQIR